jgi:hypothetical protein
MATTAITYRTSLRARDLRTVLVDSDSVSSTVVLLPQGSMDVLTAKLLHGQTCRCEFWQQAIGADPDTFAVGADQVVAQRMSVKVRTHR